MEIRDNVKWYYNPIAISIIVFVVVTIIVISLSFKYYDSGFGENVLVEAHGMLFDILVIGILILFLNKLAEKRIANQRYLDEIDDFRGWESDEAAHRIAGNIRRLNRNKFKGTFVLDACYLKGVNLTYTNLQYANLSLANLEYADLQGASLQEANLDLAKGLTIEQLSKVKILYKVRNLDSKLLEQVANKYPHLLQEPK